MRINILKTFLFMGSMFFFEGCGFSQPTIDAHLEKDSTVFRLEATRAFSKESSNEHEADCSIRYYLYSAARVSLDKGYSYFAVVNNGASYGYENNLNGLALNSTEAYMRYCNPALSNSDTGLEDDKCQYHPMGYDISKRWGGKIMMLKEKTYLFPTWDARKVMREEEARVNQCIDWSKYSKANSLRDSKIIYK
jgi:hypothetical protein